eukprot:TRINITY_DN2299_c0_g1_i2.p1 TRINITY_DN2299_c0_g1~~TRINITY_DN2299_c0_g1_i2.p1  ORF type:complete len:370 (-),score=63.72 TRINITY_DN2299_c0_g1_i2:52-1128(-)
MRVARRSSTRPILSRTFRQSRRAYRSRPRVNKVNTRKALLVGGRRFYSRNSFRYNWAPIIRTGAILAGASAAAVYALEAEGEPNWDQIREEIIALLEDENYDDGSYGPLFVRLAWHASGTYDAKSGTGGSNGATMRFKPEASDGANAGLGIARDRLEKIKRKHPEISYGDLWTFAGCVAIEEMDGPHINWRPGRIDATDESACPPNGRLPDAAQGESHVRDVFYRMGFNDREIVALIGAHGLGRCHTSRSGYDGPWTTAPTTFTNEFFVQLLEAKWTKKNWNGPEQFEDGTKTLMMLPADMSFLNDPEFKKIVEEYANDEERFFKDFAVAWKKLIELGVNFEKEPAKQKPSLWKRLFG